MKKIASLLLAATPALAQDWSSPGGEEPATLQDFAVVLKNIFNVAVYLAGITLFVMLIIGGFKYLTAGGDPKAKEAAKNTLTYAILGLVLIIVGWFILKFIEEFTGVKVTEFEFP